MNNKCQLPSVIVSTNEKSVRITSAKRYKIFVSSDKVWPECVDTWTALTRHASLCRSWQMCLCVWCHYGWWWWSGAGVEGGHWTLHLPRTIFFVLWLWLLGLGHVLQLVSILAIIESFSLEAELSARVGWCLLCIIEVRVGVTNGCYKCGQWGDWSPSLRSAQHLHI